MLLLVVSCWLLLGRVGSCWPVLVVVGSCLLLLVLYAKSVRRFGRTTAASRGASNSATVSSYGYFNFICFGRVKVDQHNQNDVHLPVASRRASNSVMVPSYGGSSVCFCFC